MGNGPRWSHRERRGYSKSTAQPPSMNTDSTDACARGTSITTAADRAATLRVQDDPDVRGARRRAPFVRAHEHEVVGTDEADTRRPRESIRRAIEARADWKRRKTSGRAEIPGDVAVAEPTRRGSLPRCERPWCHSRQRRTSRMLPRGPSRADRRAASSRAARHRCRPCEPAARDAAVTADVPLVTVKNRLPSPSIAPALSVTAHEIVCRPLSINVVSKIRKPTAPFVLLRPGTSPECSGLLWL